MQARTVIAPVIVSLVCAAWITGCNEGAQPAEGAKKDAAGAAATTQQDTGAHQDVGTVARPEAKPEAKVEDAAPGTPEQVSVAPKPKSTPVQPTTKTVAEVAKPAAPKTLTVAAGTSIAATLQTPVATDKSKVGDAVTLRVTEPVRTAGVVVVPVGSVVHGTVTHLQSAGRVKGAAELTIRFTEIQVTNGARHPVTCEAFRVVKKGDGRESAAEIGGGAAVGGVLGGVIGGKNDVLKGAAIGAAVGTGVAVATKGEQIVLPVGYVLPVRLTSPVVVGTTS